MLDLQADEKHERSGRRRRASAESLLTALRAAGEHTRIRILKVLAAGELTVSELTQVLAQSQPRVSRHLKLLCDAGLIERNREGTWVFYRLTRKGPGRQLCRLVTEAAPAGDRSFAADRRRLDEVRKARAREALEYFSAIASDWRRIRAMQVSEAEVEAHLVTLVDGVNIETLLDIGTGTGRMLELFADRIGQGLGIDLSPEMLTVARTMIMEKGLTNCGARLGDMYDLPVESDSQDVVVIHQVLHFADEPEAAIDEVARVLRPGGKVIIVDFAPHDAEFLRHEHQHRRLGFAEEEIVAWGDAAGLEKQNVTHLEGGELTVTVWTLHRAQKRRGEETAP